MSLASLLRATCMCLMSLGAFERAQAGVTFSGSLGALSASAHFEVSGSNLLVTLTNTSAADAMKQIDILTAVFFDMTPDTALTLLSVQELGPLGAYIQSSSGLTLLDPGNLAAPNSTNGGPGSFKGGWQYRENLAGLPKVGSDHGTGTNGLGVFNGKDVKIVDNQDYGLTSLGDNVATSQSTQLFNVPLIKSGALFTFSGLTSAFLADSSHISNVRFQYGTNLSEPSFYGTPQPPEVRGDVVPEPASMLAWSFLLAAGGFAVVRQRAAKGD